MKKKNDWVIIRKYFTKILEKEPILCCYEAGPCGYTLARSIEEMRIPCIIAAPADKEVSREVFERLGALSKPYGTRLELKDGLIEVVL